MARYVKCPRCDLNYIDEDLQEYCAICLDEMKGTSKYIDVTEEEEEMELCPYCGENMMKVGEERCEECKKKLSDVEEDVDPEKDEAWRDYMDDETDETLPDAPDVDEFDDEEEEEEDDLYHGEDDDEDLDYVTADEAASMAYDDDDDDEEKNEDDDF